MPLDRAALRIQYRDLLLNGIVPFWMRHGFDREHGGVLSCMTEDGRLINTNKFTWSQGRFLWVLSALYHRIEARPEWLEAARLTANFLMRNGRDDQGRWAYQMDREGREIDGPISIFADCFAVYGLNEYFRACGDERALDLARGTFRRILERIAEPAFDALAPYSYPPGARIHSISMMLTEVANRLAETTGDAEIEATAERHALRVMNQFVRARDGTLLEILGSDYQPVSGPAGTYVVPGHAIESMWFVLHWAQRRGRADVIDRALRVIRRHLELGWDSEFGGILLAVDLEGNDPFFPNAEKKVWWPHTEALYALLLADRICGEPWCGEWYQRVHEYSFARFAMPGIGEWRQRLDRQGHPIEELIALPVKDPFHLPRAVIWILDALADRPGFALQPRRL